MDGDAAWRPPPRRPKRKNTILRLYDAPPHRDWAVWLTLGVALIVGFSIAFAPATNGTTTVQLPTWLDTLLAVFSFAGAFGVLPAFVRLQVRRLMWSRRQAVPVGSSVAEGSDVRLDVTSVKLVGEPSLSKPVNSTEETKPVSGPSPLPSNGPLARINSTSTDQSVTRSRLVTSGEIVQLVAASAVLVKAAKVLPYPMARAIRALRVASGSLAKYDCLIDVVESTLVVLGISAASWLRFQGSGKGPLGRLRSSFGRGVSLGEWWKIAVALPADVVSDSPGPSTGFPLSFASAVRGGLADDVDVLLAERNGWAHGARPKTESEAAARLLRLAPVVERMIDNSMFLVDARWVVVRGCVYRRKEKVFAIDADLVMGDHPEFDTVNFVLGEAMESNILYSLVAGVGPIDLSPFAIKRYCPVCSEDEIFYADRVTKNEGAYFKSFGRGHEVNDHLFNDDFASLAGPV